MGLNPVSGTSASQLTRSYLHLVKREESCSNRDVDKFVELFNFPIPS